MGTFKNITDSTKLLPKMRIREYDKNKEDYNNYVIGNNNIGEDTYEVYPDGVDFLNREGILFSYSQSKMISRNCEYFEE